MIVTIKNAIENIKTNKMRVAVAMIWIVLGITSVIVVSSIGSGIEAKTKKTQENPDFRKASIKFYPDYESTANTSFYEPFTLEDIAKISSMKGIEKVTPKYGQSQGGAYDAYQLLVDNKSEFAKTLEYKKNQKLDIAYGRDFAVEDLNRNVVILEYSLAFSLFNDNPQSAIGNSVDINGNYFEVVGVLKELEVDHEDLDSMYRQLECYMPKGAIEELGSSMSIGGSISEIEIIVAKGYDVLDVVLDASESIQEGKGEIEGSYSTEGQSMEGNELQYMQSTLERFTTILSNVSLLIGGIGIMNIMYMSVSERKREIGIRRAIGAEPKDILIQFLIETIVITVLGGLVGIVVGTFAAIFASRYLGIPPVPSVEVYIKAVVISIMTGAVFGAIPAVKASKLDPIKAIQG